MKIIKYIHRLLLLIRPLCIVLVFSVVFSSFCLYGANLVGSTDESERSEAVSAEIQNKTVLIDAGHGGEDGGAVGINGVLEKELNLLVSEKLYTLLTFAGYKTIMTRTEDRMLYDKNDNFKGRKKILDLAERLKIISQSSPTLFVSIHMNSFPDPQYEGLTVYYSPNTQQSRSAAECIMSKMRDSLQPHNTREIKEASSNIFLLNRATCPAVLVECGFISNRSECEQLCNDEYRKRLTLVLYSSCADFIES